MVNKEDIELIFNTVLNKEYEYKSHQHLTIRNSKVIGALDKFAESTQNRKTEKGVLIDANGNEVYSKNGGKASVEFTCNFRDLYEKYGELHMEHNHPSVDKDPRFIECLSVEDMLNLPMTVNQADGRGGLWEEYCLKSITAEGANGTRMTLVRGDYYTDDNHKTFVDAVHELNKIHDDYMYNKYSKTQQRILDKLVSESRQKNGNEKTLERIDDLYEQSTSEALKEIGTFESSKEFKDVQKKFREANCKLIISRWKD